MVFQDHETADSGVSIVNSKYFPWMPGLWTYEVVAKRQPVKGDFFIEKGQVFLAVLDQKKIREIVKPTERMA